MPAPFGTCPAPKITTAEPCRRWLEDGQRVCRAHAGTDTRRQCEGETGPAKARVRCAAWPLTRSAFCAAHDPVARAERQAEKDSLPRQLAQLRKRVSPDVGVKIVELLVLRRKVTVGDVVAVLTEYRVSL
jgi:hypothetical protein